MKKDYKIVQDFSELLSYLSEFDYISYDVESTGKNVRKSKIVGIAVSGKIGTGRYLPLYTWNVATQQLDKQPLLDKVPEFLQVVKSKQLIMHNAPYDIQITRNDLGVDLTESLYCDTLMLKHTCEENPPFALKEIAEEIKGAIGFSAEESAKFEKEEMKASIIKNGGIVTKDNIEMYKADLDVLGKYASADVDLTLRIFDYYSGKLEQEGLEEFFYSTEVMPLIKEVVIPLESTGIKLDLPKMNRLAEEITVDMSKLENKIQEAIRPYVSPVEDRILAKEMPIKRGGKFAQALCTIYDLNLPKTKTGAFSFTSAALAKCRIGATPRQKDVIDFIEGKETIAIWLGLELKEIQRRMYLEAHNLRYVFNISSKHHLIDLFYNELGNSTSRKTDGGAMKMDEEEIEKLAEKYESAALLNDYNKLSKLKSTYIDRFLGSHENGEFFQQFKPWGTISGRGSGDLQQLPKPSEDGDGTSELVSRYRDEIRSFFIAKEGRKFLDTDFSSLEIRIFASDANETSLLNIFKNEEDFYSRMAIEIFNLKDTYSAKKNDSNYLGKVAKHIRAKIKPVSLGVRYGMRAYKLAYTLNTTEQEAQEIINSYFTAFPGLKASMDASELSLKTKGYVQSRFGRIRHLKEAREIYKKFGTSLMDYKKQRNVAARHGISVDELKQYRKRYNNLLNNAFNFPIQAAASSITNRAAIAIMRKFKELGIDGKICLILHDQLILDVPEKDIDISAKIMRQCMEHTTELGNLELEAIPQVAENFKDGH